MVNDNVTTLAELSDTELDLVVAAGSHSLVNINVPIAINVGVQLANQVNLALFSINTTQGGGQMLNLSAIALSFA
jgi:hypothetical protein